MGLSEWEAVIVKGVDAEGLTMAFNIFHAEEEETREAMRRVVERVVVEKYILALVWLLILETRILCLDKKRRKRWAGSRTVTEILACCNYRKAKASSYIHPSNWPLRK